MRTRATAIAGVMAMVMATGACASRQQLARSAGAGLAAVGGLAMGGGLIAAGIEDSRPGPNFGPPRETDPQAELSVAAVGAGALVLGLVVSALGGRPARR